MSGRLCAKLTFFGPDVFGEDVSKTVIFVYTIYVHASFAACEAALKILFSSEACHS